MEPASVQVCFARSTVWAARVRVCCVCVCALSMHINILLQ